MSILVRDLRSHSSRITINNYYRISIDMECSGRRKPLLPLVEMASHYSYSRDADVKFQVQTTISTIETPFYSVVTLCTKKPPPSAPTIDQVPTSISFVCGLKHFLFLHRTRARINYCGTIQFFPVRQLLMTTACHNLTVILMSWKNAKRLLFLIYACIWYYV